MGGRWSRPQPPPPPPPQPAPPPPPPPPPPSPKLLNKPWRKVNWGDNGDDLQYVKDYNPQTEGRQLRILLHGPAGAGNSSFINSVQSVLRGRMYAHALAANISTTRYFTKKYTAYKIQDGGSGNFYPFVFNDIMGLEANSGVPVDDVKLALRGHVKDGYKFNPHSKISEDDEFYNKTPNTNDKVHVLVCVFPANAIFQMTEEILQKIRDIREEASDLGIPQVAILTKIDESCPEIKQDLKNVYMVKSLKKKMEEFSVNVGIPMTCIFPVKNYHEEIDLDDDINSLILSSMRHIINFGDDCITFRKSSERLIGFNTI